MRAIRRDPYLSISLSDSPPHSQSIFQPQWWTDELFALSQIHQTFLCFCQEHLSSPISPKLPSSLRCSSRIITSSLDAPSRNIHITLGWYLSLYYLRHTVLKVSICLFFFHVRGPCHLHLCTSLQSPIKYLAVNRDLISIFWLNEFTLSSFASNCNSYHLLNSFYMCTVVDALHFLSHLIFTVVMWVRLTILFLTDEKMA